MGIGGGRGRIRSVVNAPTIGDLQEAQVLLDDSLRLVEERVRRGGPIPDAADPDGYLGSLRSSAEHALELLKESRDLGGEDPGAEWCVELRKRAERALRIAAGDEDLEAEAKGTQAEEILAIGREAELLRTAGGDLLATFSVLRHRETWPIRSAEFKGWLAAQFVDRHGKPPQPAAISTALPLLEHSARVEGVDVDEHVRVASVGGCVYVDLGSRDWSVLEVTPDGVGGQLQTSPVPFRRSRGQLPLPMPRPGGDVDLLRPYVRTGSEDDFRLIVAWLVAAFIPSGPKPALWFHGRQGAAKSTATRCLRSLVDPNQVPSRDAPREPRDLAIAAKRNWILAYDNLSALPDWLSDAFARMATGAGFGTRQLYTDDEETLFSATRPMIVNGIEELAVRGDLLDRAIVIELPPIAERERRTESELNAAFEADAPLILDALLRGVATSLRRAPGLRLEQLPRMADFARVAEAAAPAFGWQPGEFLAAYGRSRDRAVDVEIEASPIGTPLLRLLDGLDEWKGSARHLLDQLGEGVSDRERSQKSWPRSAKALHGRLRRLETALEQRGIKVDREHREGKGGDRLIRVFHAVDPEVSAKRPEVSADTSKCQPQTRIPTPKGPEADTSDTSDPTSPLATPRSKNGGGAPYEVGPEVSEVSAEPEATRG